MKSIFFQHNFDIILLLSEACLLLLLNYYTCVNDRKIKINAV